MNLVLKPEMEQFVASKVANGSYPSAADVVQAGLELLRETEEREAKLAALRRDVQIGVDQVERGEGAPMTAKRASAIWDRAMARLDADGADSP